jgi:hypothetical protein
LTVTGTTSLQAVTMTTLSVTTITAVATGQHVISTSAAADAVKVRGTATNSYSSVIFYDSSDAAKISIGYGNSAVSVGALQGKAFIAGQGGVGLNFYVNASYSTPALAIDTSGVLSVINTITSSVAAGYAFYHGSTGGGGKVWGFYQDTAGWYLRNITDASAIAIQVANSGAVSINGGINTGSTSTFAGLQMNASTLGFNESGVRSWSMVTSGGTLLIQSGDGLGQFTFNANVSIPQGKRLYLDGSGDDYLSCSAASEMRVVTGAIALMIWDGGNSVVKFPNTGTTASGANAFLDSGADNAIKRSTSSKRYKDIIGPMAVEDARGFIMHLDPMWYHSTATYDDYDDIWPGFTAERVAELDDAFVNYDGRGRPDYVTYDRLTVPFAVMLQDHESRLGNVETWRETIDQRLADLGKAA